MPFNSYVKGSGFQREVQLKNIDGRTKLSDLFYKEDYNLYKLEEGLP